MSRHPSLPKVHAISLGCPKNLVDSERFLSAAQNAGWGVADTAEAADVILINTCGFIGDARSEAVDTILENLEWQASGKRIYVTGCMVQRYARELQKEMPEVDGYIPLKDFARFEQLLRTIHPDQPVGERQPRVLLTPKHYGYLRIGDGCNNRCSYCAIPNIRGPLQSDAPDKLLAEAHWLAEQGVRELIVTAQDITRWGEDLPGKTDLPHLLEQLHAIDGFEWIRLLYLHPAGITDRLLDTIAALPKVLHYFDIPLQHISDSILRDMRRRIDGKTTRELLDKIRNRFPGCVLRTSLITGFPGEGRKEFNELRRFVEETKIERLGVFAYSPEEGTPAAEMPGRVTDTTAQKRRDELMSLQSGISEEWLQGYIGKEIPVIIDEPGAEMPFEGRAWFDAPEIDGTVFIASGKTRPGAIATAHIVDAWEYDLVGTIVK